MKTVSKMNVADKAYKLSTAHRNLRKVEKILSEMDVATGQIERALLDLLEFCTSQIMELKERE